MIQRCLMPTLGFLFPLTVAHAQVSLKDIGEFAKEMCTTIPITSTSDQTKLTGDANAKLSGFLGKFAAAGGSASAIINREATSGVLQSELAEAVKNSNDCRLAIFNTISSKVGIAPPPQPPIPLIVENCRLLEMKDASISSAVDKYAAAVVAYGDAKNHQEEGIRARFPGNDQSYNVGMWSAKEQARQAVKATSDSTIRGLESQVDALRAASRNLRSACAKAKREGAASVAMSTGSSPGDCASSAEDADGQAQVLVSGAARFVDIARARVAAGFAAMQRFPGFDASENISAWGRNVAEFDQNYQDIDKAMDALSGRATQFQAAVNHVARSCIQ